MGLLYPDVESLLPSIQVIHMVMFDITCPDSWVKRDILEIPIKKEKKDQKS